MLLLYVLQIHWCYSNGSPEIFGFPKNKIVGMAGILDSSRFIYFLSQELKVPVQK